MAKVSPEDNGSGTGVNMVDLNNRDPKEIHPKEYFKVDFHEVFAEPDPGVHSLNGVWKASYLVFSFTRLWTYRILSLFGVISAFCFGIDYGCTSCYTIWCCWPCLKLCQLQLIPIKKLYMIILDTCVAPLINAASMLCWNIRVVVVKS